MFSFCILQTSTSDVNHDIEAQQLDMLHDRYLEHQESAHGFNPLHHVNIEESIGCHKIVLYWQRYIFSLNTSCKSEGILLLLPSDDETTLVYSAYQLECWWWKVIICIGFRYRGNACCNGQSKTTIESGICSSHRAECMSKGSTYFWKALHQSSRK